MYICNKFIVKESYLHFRAKAFLKEQYVFWSTLYVHTILYTFYRYIHIDHETMQFISSYRRIKLTISATFALLHTIFHRFKIYFCKCIISEKNWELFSIELNKMGFWFLISRFFRSYSYDLYPVWLYWGQSQSEVASKSLFFFFLVCIFCKHWWAALL